MGMHCNLLTFKLDDVSLLRLIRETAADTSRVWFVEHARERMRVRRITPAQVFDCLRRGNLKEPGFVNMKGHWQCTLTRRCAGDEIHAVVALERHDDGNWIAVVTTF